MDEKVIKSLSKCQTDRLLWPILLFTLYTFYEKAKKLRGRGRGEAVLRAYNWRCYWVSVCIWSVRPAVNGCMNVENESMVLLVHGCFFCFLAFVFSSYQSILNLCKVCIYICVLIKSFFICNFFLLLFADASSHSNEAGW